MNETEKESAFHYGMAELGAVFMKEITDVTMRAYWTALSDLSADDLKRGFSMAVKLDKFWPPPSRIRELGEAPKRRKIYE